MGITGGFGVEIDLVRGVSRNWFMGRDGVKRWLDTSEPVVAETPEAVPIERPVERRPLQDGRWYWVKYEGLGKTYEAPAMYRSDARAFYSVEFSGVPEHSVLVMKDA